MDNDNENTLSPDSLEDSIVSFPDPDGHFLEGLKQFLPSDEDLDTKKIYDAIRILALSEANKGMRIFFRSLKSNPPYWDRRVAMVSGLDQLDFLKKMDIDAVHQDCDVLRYYVIFCYALERYPLVLEYNQYLLRAEPADNIPKYRPVINLLAADAQKALDLPSFRMSYYTRTQKGWAANASVLGKLYKHKLPSDGQADPLLPLKAHVGMDVKVFPPIRKFPRCAIVFHPAPIAIDFYPMLYVAEHMPEDLRDRVELTCETSKLSWEAICDALGEYPTLRDLRLTMIDTEEHKGVFMDVYGPGLRGLEEDAKAATEIALTNILIHYLGFFTWFMDIYSISIEIEDDAPDDAIPLEQLPQALQNLGYSPYLSRGDVEEQLHRSYSGTPSESAALRSDILAGETTCYPLQEEYRDGCTDTADHLINLGVAPCFLAWPKSIIPDDERAFCERLLAHLEELGVSAMYKVIGAASGSVYFYLDLMVWSLPTFILYVEEYFSQIPGGDQVQLQNFRHGSKPVLATLSAAGYRLKTPSETGEAADAKQAGNNGPANSKEKNKGKKKGSKNKHKK